MGWAHSFRVWLNTVLFLSELNSGKAVRLIVKRFHAKARYISHTFDLSIPIISFEYQQLHLPFIAYRISSMLQTVL